MRCLWPPPHNPQRMVTMNTQSNIAIEKSARPSVNWETAEELKPRRLEVNVIFTNPQATVAALKTAGSLAQNLGASIQVRAAIAVPYKLPLDKPPVSVGFIEELLSDLVLRLDLGAFEPMVHLYLCRDQMDALLQVLKPNSLVVISGQEHWWPTSERRMAKILRSKGHRVVFVGLKREVKTDLR
jgi:hypothetical protein